MTEFTLPKLPFAQDALQPHMSANTLSFHYGKHHKAYVDNLNGLIKNRDEYKDMTLQAIVQKSAGVAEDTGIFNNAAQVFNHSFFWNCLSPDGGDKAFRKDSQIGALVEGSFGSLHEFKALFKAAAVSQFGSGWAWLVKNGDLLEIVKTQNAGNPLTTSSTPILTIDVWEHAYYLDYQNRRGDFVDAVLDNLINWNFAAASLQGHKI